MKKLPYLFFVLFLFSSSLTLVAQRQAAQPPTPPNQPPQARVAQQVTEAQATQELQAAIRELNRAAATTNSQAVTEATQNVQRAIGTLLQSRNVPITVAAQAPEAAAAQQAQNAGAAARNQIIADREKAYIELARRYFYELVPTLVIEPPRGTTEITEEIQKQMDEKRDKNIEEREASIEIFKSCIEKVPPAQRIILITELIYAARGSTENLQLLEKLLDEVRVPGAQQQGGGRAAGQNNPNNPGAGQPPAGGAGGPGRGGGQGGQGGVGGGAQQPPGPPPAGGGRGGAGGPGGPPQNPGRRPGVVQSE